MTKIAIVTDTDSSLPLDLASQYNISQVPITIHFGESTYTTNVDINDAVLFEIIDQTNKLPTTSAPSPAAFEQAFKTAFEEGYESVICVCVSSVISATYQSAITASQQLPDRDITVVDSMQLSLGQGLIALNAAKAAMRGATKEEILDEIENLKKNIYVYGVVPTLKYLAMSGRVGKIAAGLADTFNIKPILTVQDGKLDLLEKIRTMKKAKSRLLELAIQVIGDKKIKEIGFIHVNNLSGAKELYASFCETLNCPKEPIIAEFTAGLSVHTGAGVVGFVILTE